MKQLTCDLCGSTDLIKNEGVFVCQSCGSKYSVEEARRMVIDGVVEVKGTVTVDDTAKNNELISNYLHLSKNALSNLDFKNANIYSSKILELDTDNYEAWMIKAKCELVFSHFSEFELPLKRALSHAKKIIDLAPNEIKYEAAEDLYINVKGKIIDMLKFFSSRNDYDGIHKLMMIWLSLLNEIPCLSKDLLKREIDYCRGLSENVKFASTNSFEKMKYSIKEVSNILNSKVRYHITFSEGLQSRIEAENQKSKSRIDMYWQVHAAERAELDSKKGSSNFLRNELIDEKKRLVNSGEHVSIQKEIDTLTVQLRRLGLFKQAEKNEILEKIEVLQVQLNEIKKRLEQDVVAIQAKIDAEEKIISQIDLELTRERS